MSSVFRSFNAPHEYDAITVTLEVAGHTFVLKENVTTVLGFKSIRQGESITEMQQPFSEGDEVKISKQTLENMKQHLQNILMKVRY